MGTSIGQRIKDLRLSHNLTQEQLGSILGVKKSAVQKYEAGDVKNIKRETIKILCNQFKVYPYLFIFEKGEYWAENEFYHCLKLHNLSLKDLPSINEQEVNLIIDFLNAKDKLTEEGFKKVIDYIEDMKQIEKYKRKP